MEGLEAKVGAIEDAMHQLKSAARSLRAAGLPRRAESLEFEALDLVEDLDGHTTKLFALYEKARDRARGSREYIDWRRYGE